MAQQRYKLDAKGKLNLFQSLFYIIADKPKIPKGYEYLEGKWYNGFVIRRICDGSEFVWVPYGIDTLSKFCKGQCNIWFGKAYGTSNLTQKYEDPPTIEGLEQIRSVFKYGGFYISRYNLSLNSKGEPQSKINEAPWLGGNFYEAKEIASRLENRKNLKSHLLYGKEYDSVLHWFEVTKARTKEELEKDSSNWGKYYKGYVSKGGFMTVDMFLNPEPKPEVKFIPDKTGQIQTNGIYDFAGGVREWTQEETNSKERRVVRGGDKWSLGNEEPVAMRRSVWVNSCSPIGIRAALWMK